MKSKKRKTKLNKQLSSIEDMHDLKVVAERKNEKDIPLDEVKKRIPCLTKKKY